MRYFADTNFYHNCGSMVHFECLSKKELNPRTGTFSCPECKEEKRVYTSFEKIASSKKVKFGEKSRVLGSNLKMMLDKSRAEARHPETRILKSVLKLEHRRKEQFLENSEKINTIEIKRSDRGLDSVRIFSKYFNL